MKVVFIGTIMVAMTATGCSFSRVMQHSPPKLLQKGRISEDTSFVYWLPYEKGSAHLLVQGYYSHYSHRNRVALDFKMKKGTKVCAARGGVVVSVRENNDKGGLSRKYYREANMIGILHADGSRAYYGHLKKNGALVNVGDTVVQGQVIGLSGNTGYTAFPHLHFSVYAPGPNGQRQAVATRFLLKGKTRYLRPMRVYRSIHH